MPNVKLKLMVLALLGITSSAFCIAPALAEPNYDAGVKAYNSQNYQQAIAYLEKAVTVAPDDVNALYYDALTWHRLKNWKKAGDRYKEIATKFPQTSAANNALAVLKTLDPKFVATMSAGGGNDEIEQANRRAKALIDGLRGQDQEQVDLSKCPSKTKIYYSQEEGRGTHFLVDVQVGGRPIKMLFDTGAELIALGNNHLRQMGLPEVPMTRKADGYASGVGAGGPNPIWLVRYPLKVGAIEIPDCPMYVQPYLGGTPLLGQTLFKHFAYTIDYGSKSISLTKKGDYNSANAGPAGGYDVPFVREGSEMVVEATVDGRPYKMYFDTGAMSCAFGINDVKKLNLQIPDDAQAGYASGVSGMTRTVSFPVKFMKLGPVEKRNFTIAVIESQAMARPLLGQTFYEGWEYTIDNARSVIRFVRR